MSVQRSKAEVNRKNGSGATIMFIELASRCGIQRPVLLGQRKPQCGAQRLGWYPLRLREELAAHRRVGAVGTDE